MTRLQTTFSRLAESGAQALVAYVTGGDPDLETSGRVLKAVAEAGADIIELGVPFSDPTADGPTIQRASTRALAAHTDVSGVLGLVRALRQSHDQPVILFGYYNPFLQYGLDRLAADAAAAGADGFLVVDLPPEEAGPFRAALDAHGLALIHLLTPTSTPERVAAVARSASGFLYYVSRTGVTGTQEADLAAVADHVAELRASIPLPICVGFGISRPDQAAALAGACEGVVVGSAIVSLVERLGQGSATLADLSAFVAAMKAPLAPKAGQPVGAP